jgi:putative tricarboxylic transport membrane protein
MKIGDRVFGMICLGLSIWLIIEALRYDYMTKFTPGPGFAPFWVGVLLGLFSLYLIVDSYMRKSAEKDEKPVLPERSSLQRIGLIILILIGYTVVLMPIGFLLSTLALVFVLLYFLEKYSIVKSLLYSTIFGAGAFLLFQYWLEVELPKCWLGLGF